MIVILTSVNKPIHCMDLLSERMALIDSLHTNEDLRTSVLELIKTCVLDELRTSILEVIKTSVLDELRTSILEVIKTCVLDELRTSIVEVIKTSLATVNSNKCSVNLASLTKRVNTLEPALRITGT